MANALAWLTGRDDLTDQPAVPFGIDSGRLLARSPLDLGGSPGLSPYYPSPSERFSSWISDLLGAGPGASLPRQNFATGVPNLLQATPLGVGLSAADLMHAKAADDPMGAAAAAIGLLPAVGGEARAVKNLIPWKDETDKAIISIEHALKGLPYPQFHPQPIGAPAVLVDIWKTDPKTLQIGQQVTAGPGGAVGTFNGISPGGTTLVNWKKSAPKNDTDVALSAIHDALNSGDDSTAADAFIKAFKLPVPEGEMTTEEATKAIYDKLNPDAPLPDRMAPAPKNDTNVALSAIHDALYDYEKDDTGLYHIFDMVSGKTHTVTDTESQAKAWIKQQQQNISAKISSPVPKINLTSTDYPSTPYTPISSNSASEQVKDLGKFPSSVPFRPSKTAISAGYTTPAIHGTVVGDPVWKTPSNNSVGSIEDALRLPSDELGVHFGTPDQAKHFNTGKLNYFLQPRSYPAVLQTGKSLELPDSGTWYVNDIKDSLRLLNKGRGSGIDSGQYRVAKPKAHIGEFPEGEHAGINSIQEMRDYLSSKGYDSVNYINKVEGPGQRSHIMFKPSPEAPDYAVGVRSPFAGFNPAKIMRPELGLGIAGLLGAGAVLSPSESKADSPTMQLPLKGR
jgi:hypothetical protein